MTGGKTNETNGKSSMTVTHMKASMNAGKTSKTQGKPIEWHMAKQS